MTRPCVPPLLALAALASACGEEGPHEHAAGAPSASASHVHEAPHGGTLVVLAEEAVNVEIVHDPVAGKITAYLLDGHAEHALRAAQPSIALSLRRGGGGDPFDVALAAVANPLTGETPGDTSEFAATDERLRGAGPFDGVLRSVVVKGTAYSDVSFRVPGESR